MITLQTSPTALQTWLLAVRPRTLPAAAAPVIAGSAAAYSQGLFDPLPALAALLGALLLQIGANLANDVLDFQKGFDTRERLGPLRVTQAGLLSARQVLAGMGAVFALAALCGLYLAFHAGWPIVVIGLLCIVSAVAYSGGPFAFSYHGLGETAVFVFFGLVAVCGTYYVQALELAPVAWWAAAATGLLATAILTVNNLRDIETDRATGKHTLVTRFGADWARREYLAVLVLSYAALLGMWLTGAAGIWALLPWLSIPLAVRRVRSIHALTGRALNRLLGQTGQLELIFSLLFALGMVIQRQSGS